MRAYLLGRGASEAFFADVDAQSAAVADDIRIRTTELGGLEPEAMFDHVYSAPHPLVDEQRRWFAEYEASFDQEGAS
jgi:2-oxoisovalerate dehydrogenase E1 component subunit alpha